MKKDAKTLETISKEIRKEKTKAMSSLILHKGSFL
jgi:hypothetical protein